MSERDYYDGPQSVFAKIPPSALTDVEKQYIELHTQLHIDLSSCQMEIQELSQEINNVPSKSVKYEYLIAKLKKNEDMQESLFKQIKELERSDILQSILIREQKKRDEDILREFRERELAKNEAIRKKYRSEHKKSTKSKNESSEVSMRADSNKKCVNCNFYNSNRRNENGQARCSMHPFWVNDNEICDSFEYLEKEPPKKINMNFKEKLVSAFGTFGFILYYIITVVISVLPIVMIGINSFWFFIIAFTLLLIFPFPIEQILWVWGFIGAIQGEQDFWAILFYVVFGIQAIRFILALISTFKK